MEWVALHPIFEVYVKDNGYVGRGKLRGPWWRQEAAEQQLGATLKNILSAAREQQQREYGRRGGGEGREGWSVSGSYSERRG